MTLLSAISLTMAMIFLAISPGPGVFATVTRAMTSGFRASLVVICGIVLGDVIYLLLATFGMSLVACTMKELFVIVKICGGAYLVWLGYKAWTLEPVVIQSGEKNDPLTKAGYFTSGLVITLSNPKVIVFYCGFLPTFIDLGTVGNFDILIMVLIIASVLFCVLGLYAWLAGRTRKLFTSRKAIRSLNKTSGTVMAATGVVIASRV